MAVMSRQLNFPLLFDMWVSLALIWGGVFLNLIWKAAFQIGFGCIWVARGHRVCVFGFLSSVRSCRLICMSALFLFPGWRSHTNASVLSLVDFNLLFRGSQQSIVAGNDFLSTTVHVPHTCTMQDSGEICRENCMKLKNSAPRFKWGECVSAVQFCTVVCIRWTCL